MTELKNNKEQLEQWIKEIDERIETIKTQPLPEGIDPESEDVMFYSFNGVHEIEALAEKRDVFQSILDEKYTMSVTDEDDFDAAMDLLAGFADTRENFEYRAVKRNARCRACYKGLEPGDDIVWAPGNKEAVILCIPCVKGLARLVRSKIL